MTKPFNVYHTCPNCKTRFTAETDFGRWMRNNPDLDSHQGIVRTDMDHIICRYKTWFNKREYQLLMVVEVKENGAEPDPAQVDILSFMRQLADHKCRNMHDALCNQSVKLRSKMLGRRVLVRWMGVHLLRFQKTDPTNSNWIEWDNVIIPAKILTKILAIEVEPVFPFRPMIELLRDRHRKDGTPMLPGL